MDEILKIDQNSRWVLGAVTNDSDAFIRNVKVNPVTGALIVEANVTSSNTMIGSTIPGGHEGSVLFLDIGSTLAEDNANFFYDSTQHFLGLGTDTPAATLHVVGSLRFVLGSDATGDIYYREAGGDVAVLPIGTSTQVLTVIGGLPSWQDAPGGLGDPGANGVVVRTALNTTTARTITGTAGKITVTDGSGVLGNPTLTIDATYIGQTSITTLGTVTTGTWNGTAVDVAYGGTGFSSYTQGDMLYASGATTLSKLAKNTSATRYISNTGSSNNPAWAQVDLTNGVTGILPVANGGTGGTAGVLPKNWDMTYLPNNATNYWTDVESYFGGATTSASFQYDASGQQIQSRDLSLDYTGADQIWSAVSLGAYLYVLARESSGASIKVIRYDRTNLAAGGTAMTILGQSFDPTRQPLMTSDGTDLYFTLKAGNSANSNVVSRYSISGTTLTYVSDTTFGVVTDALSRGFHGTSNGNFYGYRDSTFLFSKWDSSGTLQFTSNNGEYRGSTYFGKIIAFGGAIYAGPTAALSNAVHVFTRLELPSPI